MKEKEEPMPMSEIRDYAEKEIEKKKLEESNSIVEKKDNEKPITGLKSITDISAKDIKLKVDESKSMEEQTEEVVGALATVAAVQDERVAKDISDKKADELKARYGAKKIQAETEETEAIVRQQEANRMKNEAVLQTFCINKHLPDWLLKIMVLVFSPIYIVLSLVIGIPCGVVKVLIDNIDNILVTYENAESKGKRKIKTTVILAMIAAVLITTAIIVLKATNTI